MGASTSYIPTWAEESKETRDTHSIQTSKNNSDHPSNAEKQNQRELQQKNLAIYQECLCHMLKNYIKNTSICIASECKASIYKKKTIITLHINPILKLKTKTIRNINGNDRKECVEVKDLYFEIVNGENIFSSRNFTSMYLQENLPEEDIDSDDMDGNLSNSQFSGYIGETVYISPIYITTTDITSHLPFPLSVRIRNTLFTRSEIDAQIVKKKEQAMKIRNWRKNNPLSSGELRSAKLNTWYGDSFKNRKFSSNNISLKKNNVDDNGDDDDDDDDDGGDIDNIMNDDNNNNDHNSNKKEQCNSSGLGSSGGGGGGGGGDDDNIISECEMKNKPSEENLRKAYGTFLTTNHKCERGNYLEDIRYLNQINEDPPAIIKNNGVSFTKEKREKSLLENRDIVISVPSAALNGRERTNNFSMNHVRTYNGSFLPSKISKPLCYHSSVDQKVIVSNYATPYDYLASRLASLGLSNKQIPENSESLLKLLVKKEISQYQGSEPFIKALEATINFMEKHEFYFQNDFMINQYNAIVRKKRSADLQKRSNQVSNPRQQHHQHQQQQQQQQQESSPMGPLHVGYFSNGSIHLDLDNIVLPVFGIDNKDDEAPNCFTDGTEIHIYAIPTQNCESIRRQLDSNMYQKMRFLDFTCPKVEVSVDQDELLKYAKDVQNVINMGLNNKNSNENDDDDGGGGGDFANVESNAVKIETKEKEELLNPIFIHLEMSYLEIHHPETLS